MNPKNTHELNALLQKRHAKFSKKMKLIAVYIIDRPQQIALNTLATIATDIGVFPSTLVRFAQNIGFSGFAELQLLFKVRIAESPINYRQRITEVKNVIGGEENTSSTNIFHDIVHGNIVSAKLLPEQIRPELIEKVVRVLNNSDETIVCGMKRAYPVATYFNYMLNNLGVRCHIANCASGETLAEQGHWFNGKTTLIAITYNPYSATTAQIVKTAKQSGSKIILITDMELNPVTHLADYLFVVHEAEIHTFRSLTSTFCLAQAICVSIGYNQKEKKQ